MGRSLQSWVSCVGINVQWYFTQLIISPPCSIVWKHSWTVQWVFTNPQPADRITKTHRIKRADSSPLSLSLPGELSPMFVDGCRDSGYCHLDPPAFAICSRSLDTDLANCHEHREGQRWLTEREESGEISQGVLSWTLLLAVSGWYLVDTFNDAASCGNEARTGVLSSSMTIFLRTAILEVQRTSCLA